VYFKKIKKRKFKSLRQFACVVKKSKDLRICKPNVSPSKAHNAIGVVRGLCMRHMGGIEINLFLQDSGPTIACGQGSENHIFKLLHSMKGSKMS